MARIITITQSGSDSLTIDAKDGDKQYVGFAPMFDCRGQGFDSNAMRVTYVSRLHGDKLPVCALYPLTPLEAWVSLGVALGIIPPNDISHPPLK